jgi:hypothetical protein
MQTPSHLCQLNILTADCCVQTVPGVSPAAIEYGTDTTRAIANWIFGGSGNRFRDLTLIFSHAGGTMPFLIQRFEQEARVPAHAAMLPDGTLPMLRRYFYDTAQAANPVALGALTQIVSPRQLLFGTDFPYRKSIEAVIGLQGSHLPQSDLDAIYHTTPYGCFRALLPPPSAIAVELARQAPQVTCDTCALSRYGTWDPAGPGSRSTHRHTQCTGLRCPADLLVDSRSR